jgi:hypothetical protein
MRRHAAYDLTLGGSSALHRAFKQAHPSANWKINHPPRQIIHRLYHLASVGAPASPDSPRTHGDRPSVSRSALAADRRQFRRGRGGRAIRLRLAKEALAPPRSKRPLMAALFFG